MTDTDRWSAFMGRDAAFDGAFVAAVTSTGIYCRPSCPARRAKPENLRFYDLPERAEHEGFRACKRCHPRDADGPDPRIEALRRVCRFIEGHDDGPPTLAAMGAEVDLSPHQLQRSFKQVVGVTPRQYYDACRIARLKGSLRDSDQVTGALWRIGELLDNRGDCKRAMDIFGYLSRAYKDSDVAPKAEAKAAALAESCQQQ